MDGDEKVLCLVERLLHGLDEQRGAKLHRPDFIHNHQRRFVDRPCDRADAHCLEIAEVEPIAAEPRAVSAMQVGEDSLFPGGEVLDGEPHPAAALLDRGGDHPPAGQGNAVRDPRDEGGLPYTRSPRNRDLHRTCGL